MRGWWRWAVGSGITAGAVCTAPLAAQAAAAMDVCALASNAEFQEAHGVNPQIGIIPDEPVLTAMTWGPHCDYSEGSIDLFTNSSELDRVLALTKAEKQRVPVQGLGQRAFFTVTYPDDEYRRRGFLAIFTGSRVLGLSMDDSKNLPVQATRPKLEGLAKLVLPRLR
jgi:hypothetical protein